MKDCNQCGKCCIKYGDGGIEASDEDIEMHGLDIYKSPTVDFICDAHYLALEKDQKSKETTINSINDKIEKLYLY